MGKDKEDNCRDRKRKNKEVENSKSKGQKKQKQQIKKLRVLGSGCGLIIRKDE